MYRSLGALQFSAIAQSVNVSEWGNVRLIDYK